MADLSQFEEKMDQFLRGEMSPTEADEFRQSLESDPLMKSEFELNDAVVQGIKTFRRAELKARLASIPISPVPVNFWAGVGGAAVVGAITATVVYNIVVDEPEVIEEETTITEEEIRELTQPKQEAYDISEELSDNSQPEDQETQEVVNHSVTIAETPSGAEADNSTIESIVEESADENLAQPQTQVMLPPTPEESSDFETSAPVVSDSEDNESSRMEKMDVQIKQHPEYNFHYKYSDHKLFLYGSLQKEPYRLLELDQNGITNLYLAYDGKYYWLKDQTLTPEPLKPIRDRNLLKNLRELDSSN